MHKLGRGGVVLISIGLREALDLFGALLEVLDSRLAPPWRHAALRVELAPLFAGRVLSPTSTCTSYRGGCSWSSNPCISSCPITMPIAPKFCAANLPGSNIGSCRMAAGKTYSRPHE